MGKKVGFTTEDTEDTEEGVELRSTTAGGGCLHIRVSGRWSYFLVSAPAKSARVSRRLPGFVA